MDNSVVVAIVLSGALLGAWMYEAIVVAPNYASSVPESLVQAKRFMNVADPGNYFRVVAPLTQVTLLITLILNWRGPNRRRWWLLATLCLVILADFITFTYHYPRNAVLFTDPMNTQREILAKAVSEWAYGNYVRVCLILVGMICAIKAAMRERLPNNFGE